MPITLNGDTGILTPMYNGTISSNAVTPSVNMKSRIINGAMVIDQRNAGASVTIGSAGNLVYTLDRWAAYCDQNSKFSVQQNAGSVTPPAGFTNYLGVTSLAATSVGASEAFGFNQLIEGFNIADFNWGTANAQSVTLSFWVRSSLTGTFGGSLRNNSSNRSYVFSYTINSANTWEQKSVTITGDTAGTWLTNNSTGIRVWFSLGCGSTLSGTAGSWSGSNLLQPTGATSVVGTNGATFYITGVQLEVGSTATSFDYRPYGTELALCQRYYYRVNATAAGSGLFGVGWCSSSTGATVSIPYPVAMRTNPTALEQSGTAGNYQLVFAASAAALSVVPAFGGETTTQGTRIDCTVASGLTTGHGVGLRAGSSAAYLGWSAEL